MGSEEGLSWRDQLTHVRGRVVQMQKQRETDKRMQRERSEQALTERLRDDTPEVLNARYADIRRRFDRAARKFYPLPRIEEALKSITEFGDLLRFYADCMTSFGKVFSPQHKTTIRSLLGDLGTLQRGLDRQLVQWRDVRAWVEKTTLRERKASDDAPLATAAKAFSERAHRVPLSIPGDYFAHEKDNFWVADCEGTVIGYVKHWAAENVLTFALMPQGKVNFNKFVRGMLYKFCIEGPMENKMRAVRVRIGYVREVKFFTDMGFVRTETKGPSDWIYQRDLG